MGKAKKKKKNKLQQEQIKATPKESNKNIRENADIEKRISKTNFLLARLKAFLTDMFLINMPILYIATYVFLKGKEDFLHNQFVIFTCTLLYCLILGIFFYVKGQTPGFKYAQIMLCSTDGRRLSISQILIYLFVWIVELSFFLWILMFLRKDKKSLHEIISGTKIVYKPNA